MGNRMRRPTTATLETVDEQGAPYIYSFWWLYLLESDNEKPPTTHLYIGKSLTEHLMFPRSLCSHHIMYTHMLRSPTLWNMDGWETILPFWEDLFFRCECELLVLGRVILAVRALLLDA